MPAITGVQGGGEGGEIEDIRWRLNGDLSVSEVSFITVGIRSEECVVSKEVYENPKKKIAMLSEECVVSKKVYGDANCTSTSLLVGAAALP